MFIFEKSMMIVVLGYVSFDPQKSKNPRFKKQADRRTETKTDWLAVFIIQFLLPKKVVHIDVDLAK